MVDSRHDGDLQHALFGDNPEPRLAASAPAQRTRSTMDPPTCPDREICTQSG
jgi:hypothetical protein